MAILTDPDRKELWAKFMSDISAEREPISVTKYDLREAVDAIDQWIEDNQASFNQSIPLPARTELTARQKVRIFMMIVQHRFKGA